MIPLIGQMGNDLHAAMEPIEAHPSIADYARQLFPLDFDGPSWHAPRAGEV